MGLSTAKSIDVFNSEIYTVGWICAVQRECVAAIALLDEEYGRPRTKARQDNNAYTLGRMKEHYVVIAVLPGGEYGTTTAATVAKDLLYSFPNVRIGLMVGIGGGAPTAKHPIHLGDIIVGITRSGPSIIQYDYGKTIQNEGFRPTGYLNQAPTILRTAVNLLEASYDLRGCHIEDTVDKILNNDPSLAGYKRPNLSSDRLYKSDIVHPSDTEGDCSTLCGTESSQLVPRQQRPQVKRLVIHYGSIASASQLMKDAEMRDKLAAEHGVLCFEMEAAGLMNHFPCLVIRGICDYADSHKNKVWQGYAAFVAAAYAKDLLGKIVPDELEAQQKVSNLSRYSWHFSAFNITSMLKSTMTIFVFVMMLSLSVVWYSTWNINTGQQVNIGTMSGKQQIYFGSRPKLDFGFQKPLGLLLYQAPYIDSPLFVGRTAEIEHIHRVMKSGDSPVIQRRLVLGGVGGIGKTQLAIAYAKQKSDDYDTILWFDATSEATLKSSFQPVLGELVDVRDHKNLDSEEIISGVKQWLSDKNNTRWLLIFDNYDKPADYSLTSYYPQVSHGSIIITTRLPSQVEGYRIDIGALNNISHSVQILRTRSQRDNTSTDDSAQRLADRLGGLPLALATAGAYLRHSTWTFERYLLEYEKRWNIGSRRPLQLPEYQNRTLYTTWDLSYQLLKADDPEASEMLKLFAYFGHQSVWFELFQSGGINELPNWLQSIITDSAAFDSVMGTLVEYCFVEVQARTEAYSMHTYVHDWTLSGLNPQPEPWSYWYAFDCVATSIRTTYDELLRYLSFSRLVPHALRLMHMQFSHIFEELDERRVLDAERIARLLSMQLQLDTSVAMLSHVVLWKERTLGASDTDTLATVNDLGGLYVHLGRVREAEQMFSRALAGFEKVRGPDHPSTLTTLINLAGAYNEQGKLLEAEQIYRQVLARSEQVLQSDDELSLSIIHNLGTCLRDRGNFVEAEQILLRALAGREDLYGADHVKTLSSVNNLGDVYRKQGYLAKAELMYRRALNGREKALGVNHLATLDTMNSFGILYEMQGNLEVAEQMILRAAVGRENALGLEHKLTISAFSNLGIIYARRGKLAGAQKCYERSWAAHSQTFGWYHVLKLRLAGNLGNAYGVQGQLAKAEQIFLHGLAEIEKATGSADPTIAPAMLNDLGGVYEQLDNMEEAERRYTQALAEYEKVSGPDHPSALMVVTRLGRVWIHLGKLHAAEQMLVRALIGVEKIYGPEDHRTITARQNLDWCRLQQERREIEERGREE